MAQRKLWELPSAYSQDLSNDSLEKTVVISPQGIPNLIKIISKISPENNTSKKVAVRFEAPAIYLANDLNFFYYMDNATLSILTPIEKVSAGAPVSVCAPSINITSLGLWAGNLGCEIDTPVIASNAIGSFAIGIIARPNPQTYLRSYGFYYQTSENNGPLIKRTAKIAVNNYTNNFDGMPRTFVTYIAVGTLESVKNTLRSAYNTQP